MIAKDVEYTRAYKLVVSVDRWKSNTNTDKYQWGDSWAETQRCRTIPLNALDTANGADET